MGRFGWCIPHDFDYLTGVAVDDDFDNARHAYLTPDPSSQIGFSSPPRSSRRPLSSIPIIRLGAGTDVISIGRSSVQCTHPIPPPWLNLQISRVHVVVMCLAESREVSVLCRGVNPIIVTTTYESRKLERYEELSFPEGEEVKLTIGGYVVIIEAPESVVRSSNSSSPQLSPPITKTAFAEPEKKAQTIDLEDRFESPIPEQFTQSSSPPVSGDIEIYHDSLSPARSSLSPPPDCLSVPLSSPLSQHTSIRHATTVDILDALLTTIIFAEVKPTPLPRLTADLAHRMPNVELSLIKNVLVSTPCIGIVHRSGKDAAGKELSDEYYYIPESPIPTGFFVNGRGCKPSQKGKVHSICAAHEILSP